MSFDHARPQLFEFLLVVLAHSFEQVAGRPRLLLVHLRDREADVDEHPVAGPDAAVVMSSRPMLTFRRTPATSTLASRCSSSTTSTICPGIAKTHAASLFLLGKL